MIAPRLAKITHEDLVSDLFGLLGHLNMSRSFLFGVSFGSTVVLSALHRRPRPFLRAAILGGFSHRRLAVLERVALQLARHIPGTARRLPLRRAILTYNSKLEFPRIIEDRFPFYLEQNGLTPIRSLAHRIGLLAGLDLRPFLPDITSEVLLLQGNEDRIVPRRDFDRLKAAMPSAETMILPTVGHQVQLTHAELLRGFSATGFCRARRKDARNTDRSNSGLRKGDKSNYCERWAARLLDLSPFERVRRAARPGSALGALHNRPPRAP